MQMVCYRLTTILHISAYMGLKEDLPSPEDSIKEAIYTVSPNRQYRGIFVPTTPATTGPGLEIKYVAVLEFESIFNVDLLVKIKS